MSDTTFQESWDCTPLYNGIDDPRLERDLVRLPEQAASFRKTYHGRLGQGVTVTTLVDALRDYETLQRQLLQPYLFAQLLFAADGTAEPHKRLVARTQDLWQGVSEATLFLELELLQLDDVEFERLGEAEEVSPYRHYLRGVREHTPYALPEAVEQVIKRKDLTGKDAFVQLFDELTAGLRYRFQFPGEESERDATGEELLALLYHPDRAVRQAAFSAYLDTHAEQALVLASCFNNLLLDHGKEAELRGYPDLITPTCLESQVDAAMVEQMLQVTEAHYPLAREYFDLKRQLLGVDKLLNTDLYAPVAGTARTYTFAEAMRLVLEAFQQFHPPMAEVCERLLDQGRIDVAPRTGKTGGAFCMGLYPGTDPYVLLNFTGTLRDVTTLAHELGHAVHYVLSGTQNLYHYHAPLPLAETASVFGEMLVTRALLDRETDTQVKVALLCAKLEEVIATTFRQTVLTRFEQAIHRRRGEGLLSPDDFCVLWEDENARLFGDAVTMIPAYRWGWSYISHFIHARFYCFSYVFGELLVLALYQQYRQSGEAFVPHYWRLLQAGGSARPADLVRELNLDLHDPSFWSQGYALVGELLAELKGLLGGQR